MVDDAGPHQNGDDRSNRHSEYLACEDAQRGNDEDAHERWIVGNTTTHPGETRVVHKGTDAVRTQFAPSAITPSRRDSQVDKHRHPKQADVCQPRNSIALQHDALLTSQLFTNRVTSMLCEEPFVK